MHVDAAGEAVAVALKLAGASAPRGADATLDAYGDADGEALTAVLQTHTELTALRLD